MDKRTGLGVGGMLRRIGLTGLCFSRDRSFVVANEELLRWLLCMQRCVLPSCVHSSACLGVFATLGACQLHATSSQLHAVLPAIPQTCTGSLHSLPQAATAVWHQIMQAVADEGLRKRRRGESTRVQEVLRGGEGRAGSSIVMQRRNIRMQGSTLAMTVPVML